MKTKREYQLIVLLMLISTILSGMLAFIPVEKVCEIGYQESGCEIVQKSAYESTFGINNSYFGLIAFPIIAILAALESRRPKKHQKRMLKVGIILGSIVAAYFLFLQFFIIKAICKYCLIIDLATLASLGLLIFENNKN